MDHGIRYRFDETDPDEIAAIYRASRRGELTRVAHGAYMPTSTWAQLTAAEQHLVRARATQARRPWIVLSHRTAALVHGLPVFGPTVDRPEALRMTGDGGRSTAGVALHHTNAPFEIRVVDGLAVTSLERTLADVARSQPPETSVPMIDAALSRRESGTTRERLAPEILRSGLRGHQRAAGAFFFADGRSGSVGESLSRVAMARYGLPDPELQARFADEQGLIGVVDFWWPEFNLIGEFDGVAKYVRSEFTGGRTPAEVIVDEKRREDRLRRFGPRVVRWGWADVMAPARLALILRGAGLPLRRLGATR